MTTVLDPATLPGVEPVVGERQLADAGLLIGCGLGVMNAVGTLILILHPERAARAGFHPAVLFGLSLGGMAFVVFARLVPRLFAPRGAALIVMVGIAALTAEAWSFGPVLGPYIEMSYVWIGMAAHLLFSRRLLVAYHAAVGVAYAVLLATQPGNPAPLAQWVIVIGIMIVSGALAGTVAGRIRHLAREEHRLRREIDHGRRRLESANAQRQAFLAGMSHELRTPLNAIIGFADVLRERLFGPLTTEQEAHIERLSAAGRTMLSLVDEVLDLDRAPSELVVRLVDPPASIDRAPALEADPRGAAAFFLLAPLALLAMPRHLPAGFHRGEVAVAIVVAAVVDALVLLVPGIRAAARAAAHIAVTSLLVFAADWLIGVRMAPFASMALVWTATAAGIRLRLRGAAAILGLVSAGEALLVVLQQGNGEPVVRWMMVTGTALISAVVIRTMVARMFDLAEQEASIRRAADRARRDLEAATQHKLEFLRNIRSELRVPLDVVTGAGTALASGAAGPLAPKQAEYAADIVSAGRHLWSMVTDILDLATLELGTMPLHIAPIELSELLRGSLAPYEAQAAECGIRLTLQVGEGPAVVRVDAEKVRRAIGGLVSNAVKFTPPGGAVVVSAAITDRRLRIDVVDTGPGIPAEDRERIFEGFQQGAPPDMAPGPGIGLTLAQRFVELQGGRVELRSEPGQGSTFTVVLPAPTAWVPGRATGTLTG